METSSHIVSEHFNYQTVNIIILDLKFFMPFHLMEDAMFQRFLISLFGFLVLLGAHVAAEAPPTINYQGRLTTPNGQPVADGSYLIIVNLWNEETESDPGNLIWSSGTIKVDVINGVFTTLLDVVASDFLINSKIWIGVEVPPDPELFPRRKVVSTPFAIDSYHSAFAENTNDYWVNTLGDTVYGAVSFSDGSTARARVAPTSTQFRAFDIGGEFRWQVFAGDWSEQNSWSGNGALAALLTSFPYSGGANGGELILFDNDGYSQVILNASVSGDNSVSLPQSSIHSREIINEPGVASNGFSMYNYLSSSMSVLVSVVITTPTDGYIVLDGRCGTSVLGGTDPVGSQFLISDDPDEMAFYPDLVDAFLLPSTGVPVYCSRTYFKSAGTHTFHLLGASSPIPPSIASYYDPVLIAKFFPTSYGAVNQVVSSSRSAQFSMKEPAQQRRSAGNAASESAYKVDLRELELKAASARAELARAENELLKAKVEVRLKEMGK